MTFTKARAVEYIPDTVLKEYISNLSFLFYFPQIYDPAEPRFEVPVEMPSRPEMKAENPNYDIMYTTNPFTLKITRKSTGEIL